MCVPPGHPSQTRVVIFFLRGGFPTVRRVSGFNGTEGIGWPKGHMPHARYARLSGAAKTPLGLHINLSFKIAAQLNL
jgi:hypothetical protein